MIDSREASITSTQRKDGLTIIRYTDGSVTITSSLVEHYIQPKQPDPVHILHGNSKALKQRRKDVHAALGVDIL